MVYEEDANGGSEGTSTPRKARNLWGLSNFQHLLFPHTMHSDLNFVERNNCCSFLHVLRKTEAWQILESMNNKTYHQNYQTPRKTKGILWPPSFFVFTFSNLTIDDSVRERCLHVLRHLVINTSYNLFHLRLEYITHTPSLIIRYARYVPRRGGGVGATTYTVLATDPDLFYASTHWKTIW